MIQARTEITLKFDELPTHAKTSGQNTTFEVSDGTITYRITCKTKGFNKTVKTIKGFKYPYVVAASSKQFTNLDKNLIALAQTGLQVFEKVPKELKAATTDTPAEEPPSAEEE